MPSIDPAARIRLSLRYVEWPVPVRQAWDRAYGKRDRPRRSSGGGRLPAAATIAKHQGSCERFLGHLKCIGRIDDSASLAELASEDNLDSFDQVLQLANRSGYTIAGYFADIRAALQRMHPGCSFKYVTCPGGIPMRRQMSMEKRDIVPPPLDELIAWSKELYNAGLLLKGHQRRRLQIRDAMMLGVLCEAGPRLRSLTEMTVGNSLQQRGQEWWIAFEPSNTKQRRAYRARLEPWLWPMIARYLTVERVELLRGQQHDALWIDWSGTPLYEIGVAKRVRWRSKKQFGWEFGPHMFRYAIATDEARSRTGGPFQASTRLGHSDRETTVIYTHSSAVDGAATRHAAELRELRRQTEGLAERTYPPSTFDPEDL
jgi:integrase